MAFKLNVITNNPIKLTAATRIPPMNEIGSYNAIPSGQHRLYELIKLLSFVTPQHMGWFLCSLEQLTLRRILSLQSENVS